eukprot:TRINITY_DN61296_c0_g1_i1.p1 TRINITY_DN61296_c0_g1~~TRINITY_DN61296_c0_g1_i1.p1  ORF type:complete len:541 (-),score=115.27 TRINITY_DN61296_c0_g1_i1:68-1690(-)
MVSAKGTKRCGLDDLDCHEGTGKEGGKAASSKDPEQPEMQLSLLRISLVLCFNFTNGVLLASYMLLLLPLESQRISNENRSSVLGSLMFIAGITQLINPFIGLISDRCTSSLGRRRPFIIVGGILGALCILAQDVASQQGVPALYYAAYTVAMLALNTAYTAVVGLMADLVPASQSGTASGIAALQTLLGASAGMLYFDQTAGESEEQRLHSMYSMYLLVVAVPVAITVFASQEVPLQGKLGDEEDEDQRILEAAPSPVNGQAHAPGNRFKLFSPPIQNKDILEAYYIDPRQHSDFSLVFWSRTLYYIGASVQTFFKYYLKDVMGLEDPEAAIVRTALIGQLCAAMTAIPTGLLSDRIGKMRKPFIYFACVVLCIGNVANCLARDEFDVYMVAAFLGAANGIYLAMDAALALDTLPSGEEAARFMGVWGIGCFLGSALGPVLGGPVLSMCGRSLVDPTAYNFLGYAVLLGFAAFSFLASGALLIFVGGQGRETPMIFIQCWACLRRLARRVLSRGCAETEEGIKANASWIPAGTSMKASA